MNRPSEQNAVCAAILSGGTAARFGYRPKGLVKITGLTIIERLVKACFLAGCEHSCISANSVETYAHLGIPVVPDSRSGCGPLAGMEAALNHFSQRASVIMFLPCDLPAIGKGEIERILKPVLSGEAIIASVAETADGLQPLCAAMRIDALGEVTGLLDRGIRRPKHLWDRLHARHVYFDDQDVFTNLNTEKDLKEWNRLKGNK